MTDTLQSALDDAFSTLKTDDTEKEVEKPETSAKEEPKIEEPKEEPGADETEEEFTEKKVSFNDLPDELKPIYRDWQKQYTQKRQAEKAYLKKLEEELEQLKSNKPQTQEEDRQTGKQVLEADKLEEYLSTREQNRYLEQQEKSFIKIDDRLDSNSPEHDEFMTNAIIGKLTQLRDEYEKENKTILGFDFVEEGKKLIKTYDELLEKKLAQKLSQKSKEKQGKIEKSKKDNPNAKFSDTKSEKNMDLGEAISAAFDKA